MRTDNRRALARQRFRARARGGGGGVREPSPPSERESKMRVQARRARSPEKRERCVVVRSPLETDAARTRDPRERLGQLRHTQRWQKKTRACAREPASAGRHKRNRRETKPPCHARRTRHTIGTPGERTNGRITTRNDHVDARAPARATPGHTATWTGLRTRGQHARGTPGEPCAGRPGLKLELLYEDGVVRLWAGPSGHP